MGPTATLDRPGNHRSPGQSQRAVHHIPPVATRSPAPRRPKGGPGSSPDACPRLGRWSLQATWAPHRTRRRWRRPRERWSWPSWRIGVAPYPARSPLKGVGQRNQRARAAPALTDRNSVSARVASTFRQRDAGSLCLHERGALIFFARWPLGPANNVVCGKVVHLTVLSAITAICEGRVRPLRILPVTAATPISSPTGGFGSVAARWRYMK